LIVRAVGVNASAPGAKATCVACRARAGGLRSGSPAASVAGRTTLTQPQGRGEATPPRIPLFSARGGQAVW